MSDDIEAILRLADLPRPSGEKHEMDPPHDMCLGDDPCICIHLEACEQRAEKAMSRAWQQTVDIAVAHTRVSTLDAALEAVLALNPEWRYPDENAAICAVIDELREKP